MFKTIIRYVAISVLFIGNTSFCTTINPSRLLKQVINDTQKGPLSREKEERYAQQLRYLMVQKTQGHLDINLWPLLDEIKEELLAAIRCQFPYITDEEYTLYESIGEALFSQDYPADLIVETLIREAHLLHGIAHVRLNNMYQTDCDNKHNPRILHFFKKLAHEGFAPSQYCYGLFLLYGIGTKENKNEGLKYLNSAAQAGFTQASLELASYYKDAEDFSNYEKYLQLGAFHYCKESLSKLALFELQRDNYEQALEHCTRALEIDSEEPGAQFILGLMYVYELQLPNDPVKGFLLIKEAAENMHEGYDQELKRLAYLNLSTCYEDGIGIEQSPEKAQECLSRWNELEIAFISSHNY